MSKFNKGWLCCAFLVAFWVHVANNKKLLFTSLKTAVLWSCKLVAIFFTHSIPYWLWLLSMFFFCYNILVFLNCSLKHDLDFALVLCKHITFSTVSQTKQNSQSQHSHPWPMLENLSNYLKGQVLFLNPKKHCNWQTVVFPFMQIKLLQPCQWGFGEPLLDYCM